MNRRSYIKGLAAVLAGSLAACGDASADVRHRVRISAEALVDGKRYQGSSVLEVTWRIRGSHFETKTRGEALALDLSDRGTVYILPIAITPFGYQEFWGRSILRALGIAEDSIGDHVTDLARASGKHEENMPGSWFLKPAFVAFGKKDRNVTLFRVLPETFESHFGKGVEFGGLSFEFTDEPLTHTLLNRLPHLLDHNPNDEFPIQEATDKTSFANRRLPLQLNETAFIRSGV